MRKPIIGITANERLNPEDNFAMMSYAATGFVDAVTKVGGIPVILPISDEKMARHYVSIVDKIIITGGQNVDPKFYGEEKTIDSDDYHLERDYFELAIIDEAIKQKKPIFTVCRGTQLFNVALGGSLFQSIDNHWQELSAEHRTQETAINKGNILFDIYGNSTRINSFHHQSIKDLGDDLEVIAYDPRDNIIEAIQTTNDIAFLGVQWHPEFLFDSQKKDLDLFNYVVNKL